MQDRTFVERIFDAMLFIFVPLVVHGIAVVHWLLDPFGIRRRMVSELLPELARFPSATSRSLALYLARVGQRRTMFVTFAALAATLTASILILKLFTKNQSNTLVVVSTYALVGLLAFWFCAWAEVARIRLLINATRRSLRIKLNQLGLPTCVSCGYNLKGNASGICSECGQPAATPIG